MSSHDEQLLDDFLEHHAQDTIYSDMTVEEYFEHFGVKGMKWGVRKDTRGQGLTAWMIKDGASKAEMNGLKRAIARIDGAARIGVQTVNKKYRGVNLRTNAKARTKYNAEINEVFKRQYPKGLGMFGVYSVAGSVVAVAPAVGLPVSVAIIIARSRMFKAERAAALAQSASTGSTDEFTITFDFVLNENGLIVNTIPQDPDILEHSLEMTSEEFLAHYGVLGMRWGVIRKDGGRRNTSTLGSVRGDIRVGPRFGGNSRASGFDKMSAHYNKTPLGKGTTTLTRVLASGPYNAAQTAAIIALAASTGPVGAGAAGAYAANRAASHALSAAWANKDNVRRINNSPKYKGKNLKTNPKLRKEYHKDQIDSFKKALWDPRGMRLAETKQRVFGGPGAKSLTISGKDLHHAEEDSDTITIDLTYNDLGQITAFVPRVPKELADAFDEIVTGDLAHMDESDEISQEAVDFLAHWGVKGMRWGVRKGESSGGGASGGSGEGKSGGGASSKHEEYVKVSELRKKKISELSTAEMKLVNDRLNTEKKYRELNPSDHELLMRKLKKYGSTSAKVLKVIATPEVKLLMKSMGMDEKSRKADAKAKEHAATEKRKAELKAKADKKAARKDAKAAKEAAKPKLKKEYIDVNGKVHYL